MLNLPSCCSFDQHTAKHDDKSTMKTPLGLFVTNLQILKEDVLLGASAVGEA